MRRASPSSSNIAGWVGISLEMPVTSAPSFSSQAVSQLPLKPVCPVTRTRRPRYASANIIASPSSMAPARLPTMPVARMLIGHQLSVPHQVFQRRLLEHRCVVAQVIEHARLEHEEPAINPALAGLRFFLERDHLPVAQVHPAETGG